MSLVVTLEICIIWFALAVGFSAFGVFALQRFVGLTACWRSVYLSVWAGFSILTGCLLLWHFFLPVNGVTLFVFALTAITCLIVEHRWFAVTLSSMPDKWLIAINIAFAMWAANHSLGPAGMDDATYEYQAIRWFHDYPVVPGLANLHGRIGFNNSHHLFASMLSVGPWSGEVNHLFNGLFVVLTFVLLSTSLREIALGRLTSRNLLAGVLLSPCIGLVLFGIFGPMISTLKADVFVSAATITIAVLFLEFAQKSVENLALGSTILLLSSLLISVKLSSIIFAGLLFLVVSWSFLRNGGWNKLANVCPVIISLVIISSVLIRGAILSGYPLYPSTLLAIPVDWRVPTAQADAERAMITSWAQLRPTYDPAAVTGLGWLHPWLKSTILTDKFTIVLPLTLALLCWSAFVFCRKRRSAYLSLRLLGRGIPTLLFASVASMLAWFQNAPAGRFGFVYFWIVFGLALISLGSFSKQYLLGLICTSIPVILGIAYILNINVGIPPEFRPGMILLLIFSLLWVPSAAYAISSSRTKLVLTALLALGFFQIGDRIMADLIRRRPSTIQSMAWLDVTPVFRHHNKTTFLTNQTRQGFTVYETQGSFYDPLPNTRYFNPWLEERVFGDLGKGFRNSHNLDPNKFGYSIVPVTNVSGMEDHVTPN